MLLNVKDESLVWLKLNCLVVGLAKDVLLSLDFNAAGLDFFKIWMEDDLVFLLKPSFAFMIDVSPVR